MILLLISVFAANILFKTGFFRDVNTSFSGKIYDKIKLPGVEDIAISPDNRFMIFSSDNRKARITGEERIGALYLLDLEEDLLSTKLISDHLKNPILPHGISLIQIDSAMYSLFVINHADGHSVEVFHLIDDSLIHIQTIKSEWMINPNDIVAINENEFYFTNDHKNLEGFDRIKEDYLGFNESNVVRYVNGEFQEVAKGIGYANGINFDFSRSLLFVAASREFKVHVYQRSADGQLSFIESIKTKSGVDNIEFDEDGKLWIGAHPNLMKFARYAQGKEEKAPSEIITIDYKSTGDYEVKSIFTDDGSIVSASSVAVPFNQHVFIGNVMDENIVIWQRN